MGTTHIHYLQHDLEVFHISLFSLYQLMDVTLSLSLLKTQRVQTARVRTPCKKTKQKKNNHTNECISSSKYYNPTHATCPGTKTFGRTTQTGRKENQAVYQTEILARDDQIRQYQSKTPPMLKNKNVHLPDTECSLCHCEMSLLAD